MRHGRGGPSPTAPPVLPHLASAPNINHLWAGLLVEELVRQGTTFFVVCPGSRSTPLAVAVGQNPRAEALVHWDERAAAFVALGWGRATGRPAAVVTTSGTAVANLLPAAVEADAAGVPLLLLTADRPPELRETGANQTVRQPPVFQDVARWSLDSPVPTTDVPARWVLSTAAHAAHRAAVPPGPVHLNLPFREPLGGAADGTDVAAYLAGVDRWTSNIRPYTHNRRVGNTPVWIGLDPFVKRLSAVERGLVVFAESHSAYDVEPARALAGYLGWPLLADVTSQARWGGKPNPVAHYDLALTASEFSRAHRPDAVVLIGGRPTSKRLLRLIEVAQPDPFLVIQTRPTRLDPVYSTSERVVVSGLGEAVYALIRSLRRVRPEPADSSPWLAQWERASVISETAAIAEMVEDGGLSEPWIARRVASHDMDTGALVLAASMPVRDMDTFAPAHAYTGTVVSNRGASGIDGTVATAYGVARATARVDLDADEPDKPTFLLVGDLALLHDQTSLALLRTGPPVVVVVVNNDGGGIFHRLPIAGGAGALDAETFERFFGTPHGLGFEDAARQVGLAYYRPETMPAFEAALDEAVRSGASALIEVRTDREEQAVLRRRIEAAAAAAVDAALATPPEA